MIKTLMISLLSLFSFFDESGIYSIRITKFDGTTISLSDYSGRKILITALDPSGNSKPLLKLIDSVNATFPGLISIAVPSYEYGGTAADSLVRNITGSDKYKAIITIPEYVTKSSNSIQHGLFKWLTNVKENGHFDSDVRGSGQIFIINETGVLYAVLDRGASFADISYALNQKLIAGY